MSEKLVKLKAQFGTAPVFLTAISTILGAVMFLRFGYAVGNIGLMGTLMIIIVGHLVTIPTAMAISEIATNQKVEGGGEYFIISRSFGLSIGSAIGIALYLSQAISVAFYIIAFAQAFDPVIDYVLAEFGYIIYDKRLFSVPALLLLILLMLTKGADLGMKALYVVVVILAASLIFFFIGSGTPNAPVNFGLANFNDTINNPESFFYVFAICFPAFTGMTAGVGLSGDLKDPKKSIPFGTMSATIVGMVIYCFIAYKLAASAGPDELNTDQLIMSKIALWGPIIPLGLAAATVSSALGSFMVAPRTLQALAGDKVFPTPKVNVWLGATNPKGEPRNATLVTSVIALAFVAIGDVNAVAEVISMFFMVTYGALCLISFFQHFAADPSYRPSFKSKWFFSLWGAIACIYLMFKMNAPYAMGSIGLMVVIYVVLSFYNNDKKGIAFIFQGVIFQLSRQLQVFLQKVEKDTEDDKWRPSIVCFSESTFTRFHAFDLMKWISFRYGFGTYIHYIRGYFSTETQQQSEKELKKLIKFAGDSKSNVFLDTMIGPSFTATLTQLLQLPGISGKDNNMLMFEYSKYNPEDLSALIENYGLIKSAKFDLCILGSAEKGFGYKKELHVWITEKDYQNANLMILLAYILLGHPEWKKAEIKIFAIFPENDKNSQKKHLLELIKEGRLPISPNNIQIFGYSEGSIKDIINKNSADADLTIMGLHINPLGEDQVEHLFEGYDKIGSTLFVSSMKEKMIS